VKLRVVGTLKDRSELSDEMADLCEKLPIFRVEGDEDSTDVAQRTATVLRESKFKQSNN